MMLCWQEDVTEKLDEEQVDDSEEDVWKMINLHQFVHFQRYARNAKIGLIKYIIALLISTRTGPLNAHRTSCPVR